MTPWDWLGLDREASEAEVKRAYAKALRRHRPDEDPQGFQTTHEAYQIALQWARRRAWSDAEETEAPGDGTVDRAEEPGHGAESAPSTREPPGIPTPESAERPADAPIATALRMAPGEPRAHDLEPPAESAARSDSPAIQPDPPASAGDHEAYEPPSSPAMPTHRPVTDADDADPATRTQPVLPLDIDAPLLRRLLAAPTTPVDLDALRHELTTTLATLHPEQRQWIAQRVATTVESWSDPPSAGVVTVLAEQLDWDMVFLRYRPDRIAELLAADEAHALLQARLQNPATLSPALRALTRPVRLFDRYSWPLWLSTPRVGAELMQIRADAPLALSQLDAGAVRLVHALLDLRVIRRERVWRWVALATAVAASLLLLIPLFDDRMGLGSPTLWSLVGSGAGLVLGCAYLRARVQQVYVLPLEPARHLWLVALLLGVFLLGAAEPDALGTLATLILGYALGSTLGRARMLPGLLVIGATLMLPEALKPLIGPPPEAWFIAAPALLTTAVLALDYGVARAYRVSLEDASQAEKPLYLLGAAVFFALMLAGAATEEFRKPVPVKPTHSA